MNNEEIMEMVKTCLNYSYKLLQWQLYLVGEVYNNIKNGIKISLDKLDKLIEIYKMIR